MSYSIKDAFILTLVIALVCVVCVQAQRLAYLRAAIYPAGRASYSYDFDVKGNIFVHLELTHEEFAELYPDEWTYVVEPKIKAKE